jgi:mRNA interferase MazF
MQEIYTMKHTYQYHRGAVFYVDFGEPDGTSKQAGLRPCVLISSETNNRFSPVVNVLTFSSSQRKQSKLLPVHIRFTAEETGMPRDCICLCEQPMTVSKTELQRYVTTLSAEQMERISEGIRCQLSL